MQHTFKVGDRIRLINLDGTLGDKTFAIHDLWGEEEHPRNVSFLDGHHEQIWHTDLIRLATDKSPVVVPEAGEWYIARGSNMGWGRAKTVAGAVKNMRRNGSKVDRYTVHRVSKWTNVDGMGYLTYPSGIEPVEVRSVGMKKESAR